MRAARAGYGAESLRLVRSGSGSANALVPCAGAFACLGAFRRRRTSPGHALLRGLAPDQERRPMARAEKVAAVAELTERFQTSAGAVLTEYRGLTVAQLAELRRSLGEHTTFTVVKNTLTKIAATDAGVADQLDGLLSGPSAIAFVDGDVVEAAKGLRDFSKANPFLVIKGGVLDGKAITPAEISRLADLESREVLLAKLAGAMKASMSGAAAVFAALPAQMAQLAEALRVKRAAEAGADGVAEAGAGGGADGATGAVADDAAGPAADAGAEAGATDTADSGTESAADKASAPEA
jgi:large subunit ribosomal protein L10